MLKSVYLLLSFSAFFALYLGVVRRRAELLLFIYSFVVFAALSIAASNVEIVSNGAVLSVSQDGLSALALGLSLVSLVLAVASVMDWLPESQTSDISLAGLEKREGSG